MIQGFPPQNSDLELENSEDAINIVTIENTLKDFQQKFVGDEYAESFIKNECFDDVFDTLAKMTILLKFNDEGSIDELKRDYVENSKKGIVGLTILNDNHPLLINGAKAKDFSFLFSLLINSNSDYYGRSFILNESRIDHYLKPNKDFFNFFTMFMIFANNPNYYNSKETTEWFFFPSIKSKISNISTKLETVFENDEIFQKLMFIASVLKTTKIGITEDKYKLISLVSIIEMLITHNPDYNRFNIEDSINKQFCFKIGLILYFNNTSIDLTLTKKKIKLIYALRSDLAHGNFKNYEKKLSKFYEFYKTQIDEIDSKEDLVIYLNLIIEDLYKIVKIIIENYISDYQFVDFLKDG